MKKYLWMLAAAAFPWLSHAQGHIDGVWKTDARSFTAPSKPSSYLLKDGQYTCFTCAPKLKVKADGADQPVPGNPYLDSMAVKVIDDAAVEMTARKGGRVLSTGKVSVSADGKTMLREMRYQEANGSSSSSTEKLTRVGPPPKEAHPISGTWKFSNYEWLSDETSTFKTAAGVLSMNGSDGMSYDAPLDGTRVPVKNSPGTDMVSVRYKGGSTWEETSYRGNKVIWVNTLVVSPDGEKMKVTWDDRERGVKGTYTMSRQ
ncbi:hypothetical protein [Ramlibacter sp. PS4R-6]|uniref:hypothetical protein n=1 Tax=Ramlibacter sp. PS4R-6 TaxID=3133438 RepID=UPI003096EC80